MKLTDYKKIHFAGIGGISMSGLAEILYNANHIITGSDNTESDTTRHLESIGIKVCIGQKKENIEPDTNLFVYTAALKNDNPEILEAERLGIKIVDRAELLGSMMRNYTYPISVAGTHGKTTTTSMITEILLADGSDPAVTVGGILPSIGGNFRIGGNKYFVVESCEYCDSFLKFNPFSGVILNIEYDHADYFKSLEQLYNSFNSFAKRIPKEGFLVINKEIPEVDKVLDGIYCETVKYGIGNKKDFSAEDVVFDEMGFGKYTAVLNGKKICDISLSVPGRHNILNSLGAAAVCYKHGISAESIAKGLKNFGGTNRRFEYKGSFNGVRIIDDYAHHPTEIKSTLSSAKVNGNGKVWCVFQPHTFSRTKALLKEFSESFDNADNIIVLDIYPAREKDDGTIHSKNLADLIKKRGKNVLYSKNFEEAERYLISHCNPQDMLITMGAGDVYLVGEDILSTISTELPTI